MKRMALLRIACILLMLISFYAYALHQSVAAIAIGISNASLFDNSISDTSQTDKTDPDSLYASDGTMYEVLDYSPLLSEEVSQREQFEKHFQREDRAYEAVIYPYPVHYDANGTWEDIDNTLKEDKTSTGKTVYSNTANAFKVEFSASYTEKDELVSVTREGYSIGFGFIDFGSECDALIKNNHYDTPKDSTERDMQMRFPAQLTSEISYDEIAENKSLTYRITPVGVTELIKLDNIAAAENAFSVKLYVSSDLIPAVNDDGSIEFSDGKEIVFRLDAPYMYDSNNEISTAITVMFEKATEQPDDSKTTYTYQLFPDAEWLMSTDRAYPVVIDPSVTTPFESSAIQDAFVSSEYPDDVRQQSNPGQLNVGYGSSSGKNRTYVKFNTLPTLKSGDMVIQSTLYMYRTYGSSSGDRMTLHNVTGSWSSSSITWNNQPSYNSSVVKALAFGKGLYQRTEWEITDLMKKWYGNPSSNYGVIVKCETEGSSNNYYQFYSSDNAYYTNAAPFANVIYVNSTGLENIWSYHSQSVGEAGTGYVNDYNGNLTFIHSDAVTTGGILPVAVNHVYNTNDRDTDHGYGAGWRINYGQTLEQEDIGGITYYKHTDGDGTAHYYYHDSSLGWVNELDKETKLDMSEPGCISIVDKENNMLVFNSSTGNLIHIRDKNNSSSNKEITITHTKITTSDDEYYVINKITDGTGLVLNFTYSDNHLTKISCPDGTGVEFDYNSYSSYKNLHYIYYLGTNGSRTGEVSTYGYSNRYMTSATNYSGYKIAYAYDLSTNVGHRRVNKITEYAGSTQGQYVNITYGWNTTTFVDNNDRDEMYQFNNLGEPVCIRNADDSAQYCAFNSADRTQTQIAASSKLQRTTLNLLSNHSFETVSSGSTLNDWYSSGTLTFPRSSTYKNSGSYSMKVNMSSTSEAGFILQNVGTLTSGSTYTLSGYFYGGSGAQLIIGYRDSGNTWHQQTLGEVIAPESGEWMRSYVTFTAVASATYHIGLYIPTATTVTNLYADSFMLEKADALNRYNMITNPDLSSLSGWTTTGTCTATTSSSGYHPTALNNNVIRLKGNGTGTNGECYISQEIAQAGAKGDCYTFGGWMKCDSIPQFEQGGYTYGLRRIRVQFYYNSTWNSGGTVSFNADTSYWQYACGAAVAKAAYSKMRIIVEYTRNLNYAYVDGIQLFRDEFAQSYTYDSDGNITKVNTLAVKEDTFTYDANDNLTKYTDSNGNETNYTYDSNHNLTKVKSATGLATSFEYDDNGLVTLSATYKDGTSTGYFLASKIEYNTSTHYLKSKVTDARGNSTSYTYKNNSRLLATQTNPNNTKATYSYDTRNRLSSVAVSNGSTSYGTVSYTYDNYNRRTGITHNGFDYVYTYDGFGNVLTTKVKCGAYTITLATNEYDNARGTLTQTTLGSGTVVTYNYDDYDRIKNVQVGNTVKYEYTYDNEGNLSVIKDNATGISTQYYYDTAGRTSRVVSSDGSHAAYSFTKPGTSTLDVNIRRIEYGYDGSSWGTRYAYDEDNRLKTVTLNNSHTVNYEYSSATGLLTSRTFKTDGDSPTTIFSESFVHLNGNSSIFPSTYGGTVKSTLISSMTSTASGTGTYNYTYDVSGNITKITNTTTGEDYRYVYDNQNQLVRENLKFSSSSSSNKTVTYTYDNYGNLLTKNIYAYTTGTLGTVQDSISYGYTNTTWKDLLKTYDGATIIYDNSGNPTSYRGDTMQWTNNQLTQQTHNGSTITYTYNESGLRTKKNVSGGTQTTYVWKDGVLCAMQSGTKVLEFSYSANGDVVSVLMRNQGASSGTRYYYARNAQGDIIGIVNSSGTMVIRYVYDSWGKLLTTTGTATIGTLNPFRYRGYIYDTETGLYYLKTRYYDPEVGRFINADVLMSTGQGVIGCNMFCYCLNNPVNMADESGCVANFNTMMTDGGGNSNNPYMSEESKTLYDEMCSRVPYSKRHLLPDNRDYVYMKVTKSDYEKGDWDVCIEIAEALFWNSIVASSGAGIPYTILSTLNRASDSNYMNKGRYDMYIVEVASVAYTDPEHMGILRTYPTGPNSKRCLKYETYIYYVGKKGEDFEGRWYY